ncbi:transcription elongation factor GreA [soil metagenome]
MRMNDTDIAHELSGAILLTARGFATLKQELEHLTTVKRPEIADRIRESQQHGEFSEDNTELDEVKFEQAMVENRIAELKSMFSNAQILDESTISGDRVSMGTYVSLEDMQFDDEFEVRIVSGIEADPTLDLISSDSPMGTALMGHAAGDIVTFDAPEGKKRYKVIKLRAR